jgi:hypothetical protein
MTTPHWILPCSACNGGHAYTQPLKDEKNPYREQTLTFECPVKGSRVTVSGAEATVEDAEIPFPALVVSINEPSV